MNRIRLFAIANILAAILVAWTLSEFNSSTANLTEASARNLRCNQLVSDISALRLKAYDAVVVMAENFDPSQPIADAVKSAGLFDETFSVSETGLGTIDGTSVQRWRVNIPASSMTLQQAVQLVGKLADDSSRFQVGVIRFEKPRPKTTPKQPANIDEKWNVEFRSIVYLKNARKR